jgi:hypothetical protein
MTRTLSHSILLDTLRWIAAAGIAAASVACSAPGSTPPANVDPGSSGGASSGGTTPPATNDGGPVSLPFTVSDDFVPSGFMGDSPTDFNGIKMSSDSTKCITRLSGAKGACYTISWTPTFVGDAGSAWVGVYWQYPSNNWGAKTGRVVAPGATKVTFSAAGAAGGEAVEFIVGGVNNPAGAVVLPNADSFNVHTNATLTTSWATYEVSLADTSYSSVIGGFAWSITTSSTTPITFYIDDIEWE